MSVQARAPLAGVGPDPAPTVSLSASVNPFRPGSAPLVVRWSSARREAATLEVLDLAGRRVATLASDVADPGAHMARWDGRDDRGEPAAPAIYLLRLRSGTASCTLRLVLVR